jgi:ADP-heptose:LPS heptosyltransferase
MSSVAVRLEKLLRAITIRPRAPKSVRRVLIAHQLLLGDTLLLAPLLKQLAALYPEAERVLLVNPAFLPLFAGRPYGVTVLPFLRRDTALQRQVLRSGPYDLAIVPDDNRYAWLARGAGARWITGFANDKPAWKNVMLDQPMSYPSDPKAWADAVPEILLGASPARFCAGEWPAPAKPVEALPGGRYAVLHIGASTRLKAWPAARWNVVADAQRKKGLSVIFSGSSKESHLLEGIRASETERAWFGRLDLAGLWHLLAGAACLICPDTGIAHLARLAGVRTVAMFGPGSAVIHGAGDFWHASDFTACTSSPFPCRDQTRLFRREVSSVARCGRATGNAPGQCPEPLCMQAISADSVLDLLAVS